MIAVPAFCLLAGLWCAMFRRALRLGSVPVILSLAFLAVTHLVRPAMFLMGALPFTTALPMETGALSAQAMLWITLYLAFAWLAFELSRPVMGALARAVPRTDPVRLRGALRAVAAAMTLLSMLLIAWRFSQYGSLGEIMVAAKIDKAFAGTFGLRQVAGLGAMAALILAADAMTLGGRAGRGSRRAALPWLLAGGLCCFAFALWGSRLEVGVLLLCFITALAAGRTGGIGRRALLRLAWWGGMLTVVVTLLYIYRLDALAGSAARQRDLATTVAISMHAVRFDALLLILQDAGTLMGVREGQDFLNGVVSAVPRALWEGKPDMLLVGAWFRTLYEPAAVNGWVVGVVGEYLLNFGPAGVPLGGAVYGVILQGLHQSYRRMGRKGAFAIFVTGIAGLLVFPEGSVVQAVPRLLLWIVPVVLIGLSCLPRRRILTA